MSTRRRFLAGALALGLPLPALAEPVQGPVQGDDGLYREPWFLESFLDLPDDLKAAREHGKRLAVLWELKGCPYCKEMHLVNFADPVASAFIRERFEILQLNIIGAREVTDFDGETLTEKRFAEKYGIRFTPSLQFFPTEDASLAGKRPREREVLRMQGYVAPADFRRTFAFVAERAYERTSLREYLRAPDPAQKG
ncbi:thioredoxin family protein [Methylobacterium sp. NEAU 140]|uniref:thioredoxin family protein n=1 Tax=Methylobacterium sp. NEAU 140 TaxID=3064945 RepID=UPI00273537E3|nr:thioredoxin family protein [Methylobacterium sp. NEAU 140]MDP4024681.1 thioredoxin family protein [Methylobacterium sp. NEAU 140]